LTASHGAGGVEKAAVGSTIDQSITAIMAADKQGGIINYYPCVDWERGARVGVKGDSAYEVLPIVG